MPKRINLLPKTERVRTTTNYTALGLMAGAVIVVFVLALSYYLLSSERSNLQSDLTQLKKDREKLEQQVAALNEYKALETQVKTMEDTVRGVYAGRTLVAKVLNDFSRALPENVWLVTMTLAAGDPQTAPAGETGTAGNLVSGTGSMSIQGNTYSFPDVATLLVRLKLVSSLSGITLNSAGAAIGATDPAKHAVGFSLVATIVHNQLDNTQLPISRVEGGL